MLGQVPGDNQDQVLKPVKIGDLSMRTNYIPVDDVDQAEILKDPDGAPISRFATTWLLGDLGFFRVYLLVVGPKSEEPKSNLSLCCSKAEDTLKAISDVVVLFNK